jgi:hypothetical protein
LFSPDQDLVQVTNSLIDQKVASLQQFVEHFGVELWNKPGTVGFYFPIVEQPPQTPNRITKGKLSTVTENSNERQTSGLRAATFI